MTRDDVIRMAREAGCIKEDWLEANTRFLERFARAAFAAGVAAEREACAKICDDYAGSSRSPMNFAENCAAAIRARGQA